MEGTLEEPQTEECRRAPSVAEENTETSLGSLLVPERLAVWVWVLGYTALLSSLSILRYGLWIARGDDLGLFEQGLWLLLHHGLHAVSTYTGRPILVNGASSILLPLAPLYAAGGVGLLLVLQSLAFGAGYYFIRRLGRAVGVDPTVAHWIGVIYLIYPTVLAVNLYDFHPQAFGIPLLLAAACALIERRWTAYLLLIVAAGLVGGYAAVALIGLGIALVLQRRAAWGAAAALIGLGAGAMDSYVLIPWLTHGAGNVWLAVYGSIASRPPVALAALLRHPAALVSWAKHVRPWEYIAWLVGPFAGVVLTLRARMLNTWWVAGLLLVEMNLVSSMASASSPFTEYSALAVPFFFTAVVVACRGQQTALGARRALVWLAPVAMLLVVFGTLQFRSYRHATPENVSKLQAAIATVPGDAPVIAQDFVLPHIANRTQEWQLAALGSFTVPAGTYLILDSAVTPSLAPAATVAQAKALLANKEQTAVVFASGGVVVGRVLRAITPSR